MQAQVYLGAFAIASAAPLLAWSVGRSKQPGQRVARNLAANPQLGDLHQLALQHSAVERTLQPLVRKVGSIARRLTPKGWVDKTELRLTQAGSATSADRFLAFRLALGLGGLGLGAALVGKFGSSPRLLFLVASLVVAGYGLPGLALRSQIKERGRLIGTALPAVMDQITISVEAGLGFEAALARAARSGSGPLNQELARMLQEIKIGMPRAQALRDLAARVDLPELRHFAFAVIQAETYGMPIADVLRVQASELRVRRRQRAEEQAMKLPVKILFPLVLCIFPTMFIVLVGPAAIQLARVLFGANV